MASVNIGARYLFPVAMAAYGIGMLKTRGWPAWLAWLGVAVGVVTLALFTFGITLGPVRGLLSNWGAIVWVALVGVIWMGKTQAAEG